MPHKSLKKCAEIGCMILTRESRCPTHTLKRWQKDKRESPAKRGYNYPWKKKGGIREYVLSYQPTCHDCNAMDKLTQATVVHHIDHDSSNNRIDNLMSLCAYHHEVRHGRIKE